jgi:hypothetical protein
MLHAAAHTLMTLKLMSWPASTSLASGTCRLTRPTMMTDCTTRRRRQRTSQCRTHGESRRDVNDHADDHANANQNVTFRFEYASIAVNAKQLACFVGAHGTFDVTVHSSCMPAAAQTPPSHNHAHGEADHLNRKKNAGVRNSQRRRYRSDNIGKQLQ